MGLWAGSLIGELREGVEVGSLLGAYMGALVGFLDYHWVLGFVAVDVGYSCWQPQYLHRHRRRRLGFGMGRCCVHGTGELTAFVR